MAINVRIGTAFNSKGLQQAQSQFQKFGKSIKRGLAVGAIVAASVVAIGQVAARFAKMAEEAQVANNRLDQIAHSMGLFGAQTSKVTKRLKDYASANMFVLGADDEVIKATQAKLLTFKELAATADVAGGAFDRATQASFDLAAVFGGDGASKAVQLGKALQDPIKGITALTKSGVTFTEAEKQLIRTLVESGQTLKAQDMILSTIEAQVGGTAEATATASTKMSIALGEIGEAIGTAVLPMFEVMAEDMIELVPKVQAFFAELTDPTTEVGDAWYEMQGSVMAFGDQISSTWGQIGQSGLFTVLLDLLQTVFIALSQILWVAGDAGKTLGMLFTGDFAGAGAQVSSFFTRYNGFVDDLYSRIDAGAADLASKATKRFEAIGKAGTGGTGGIGGATAGTKAAAKQSLGLRETLETEGKLAAKEAKLLGMGISEGLVGKIVSTAKTPKALTKEIKRLKKGGDDAVKNLQSKFNKTKAGQRELAAAQAAADAALAESTQRTADTLAEKERVYQSFVDSVTGLFESLKSSIMGAFNLPELGGSTNSIIRNMKKLIAATKSFSANISELSTMGLSPELLQQVIAAGPMAGARLASSLVAGGSAAIAEISQGFTEFSGISSEIAMTGVQSRFGTTKQQSVYNINVNGGVGSGPTIGQAIVEAIKAYERTSGPVWQGA